MPLWKIYHPVNAYTSADKQQLAERITNLYRSLPKFYVGVVFQEVPKDAFLHRRQARGQLREDLGRSYRSHPADTRSQSALAQDQQ